MDLPKQLLTPDGLRVFLKEALSNEDLVRRVREYLGENWALSPARINNWRLPERDVPHQVQEGAAMVLLGMPELVADALAKEEADQRNPLRIRTAWHVHYICDGEDEKTLDCYAFRYWEGIRIVSPSPSKRHLIHRGLFERVVDPAVVKAIGQAVKLEPHTEQEFKDESPRLQFQAVIQPGGPDVAGYSVFIKDAMVASVEASRRLVLDGAEEGIFWEAQTATTRYPTENTYLITSLPNSAHKDVRPQAITCASSTDPGSLILTMMRQESLHEALTDPDGDLYAYSDLVHFHNMEDYKGDPPMPPELEQAIRQRLAEAMPGQDTSLTVRNSRKAFIARFDHLLPDTAQAILYELPRTRKPSPARQTAS